ncbi:Trk system potassium transporter TrkA [Desulfogranum mediterraneum]|uniref:Trk system potassium transporter TrkA n=1 Tax=Desulfogranum mediterraneum TaxID=160661 RepID=UPI00040279A0|nr:Trk system potassium transporter TrkA [Desulfogranum mediterraneum]
MFGKKKIAHENILILGLGGIGSYLAKRLLHEGYAITVIEPNAELIRYADGTLDARLVQGNAMSLDCWKEAHAKSMDYLIAVTDNDAINMLSSMIADRFGIPTKIARVRSQDFGHDDSMLQGEDLKIDLFIHPEELAAQEIVRMIKRTAGDEIIDIALGQMQVMATRITGSSPFAHKNLIDISRTYHAFPFRVVAISRGITTIIPSGEQEILPQDQVLIMADKADLPKLMELTGVKQQRRHRVMILGGGLAGARIAELLGRNFKVTLLEKNAQRAEELSFLLKDSEVLHGDGSDKEVLEESGLKDIDTFIASTGENETNIMSCILAKHLMAVHDGDAQGVQRKTICLVTKEEYLVLASTSGLDIVLNKKLLAGNEILTFIRGSELLSISHMHGFDAEVIDLIAAPGAPITRKPLAKLTKALAGHIIVGSVFRDGEWKTAVGDTHIHGGDRAIVISNSSYLKEVRRLFSA